MQIVDSFLDFLATVHGKTPDKLKTIERQAIAVLAVAAFSRFAPAISQGAVINAVTRRAGFYVARHPLATVAAFWFAAYRNAITRPQWAGTYTREIETAALVPVFGQARTIIRYAGRGLSSVLRPGLAQNTSKLARLLSGIRIPTIPQSVVNNPATRATARYVSRHPAALLSSYFAGQFIDTTFRPQFLGDYSQELITAGLLPVFAHGPKTLPWIIRGVGSAAYWGCRGTAFGLDAAIGILGPRKVPSPALRSEINNLLHGTQTHAQGSRVAAMLAAEGFAREAQLANAAVAAGRAVDSAGIGPFVSAEEPIPSVVQRAWKTYRASRAAMFSVLGGSRFRDLPWRMAHFKFLPAWPRVATWGWRLSWVVGPLGKIGAPLALGLGAPDYIAYPLYSAAGLAVLGYASPLFTTGSLAGTAGTYAHEVFAIGRGARWLATRSVPATFNLISRLRFHALYPAFAPYAPAVRAGATALATSSRLAVRGTAALASGINAGLQGAIRIAGSVPAQVLYSTLVDVGELGGGEDAYLAAQVRLRRASQGDRQALMDEYTDFMYSRASSVALADYAARDSARGFLDGPVTYNTPPRVPPNISSWVIDTLLAGGNASPYADQWVAAGGDRLISNARASLWRASSRGNARGQLAGIGAGLLGLGQFIADNARGAADYLEIAMNMPRRFGGGQPDAEEGAAVVRDAWRNQPRDALGRFRRNEFGFNTGQPLPGVGFDQVLAYINRLATAAAQQNSESATIGIPVRPAIQGGLTGSYTPGKGREFWLYRGRDRNLMLQTFRDLQAICERDILLEGGKKTTKLSTRHPILADGFGEFPGALVQVIRALKYKLGLVRNRGPLGGYRSLSEAG